MRSSHRLQTSDIASLVTAVALDRYLVQNGWLAFVMPKSVIQGDPGNRAFRQYHLKPQRGFNTLRSVDIRFRPISIHDFSEVKPFSPDATNIPIVVVIRRDETVEIPIPGARWSRRTPRARIAFQDWQRVKNLDLVHEQVRWHPINTFQPSPLAWWRDGETPVCGLPNAYEFGKGLDTRGANGVYFVRVREPQVRMDGRVRISNTPTEGRNEQVIAMGERYANVEAELLVPLVRGRDVGRFSARASGYMLLPYNSGKREELISEADMLREYPGVYNGFLRQFRDVLLARRPYAEFRPSTSDWWQVQGVHHLAFDFLVCMNEIANPPSAAVVTRVWDPVLGKSVVPVVDHKITFYGTDIADEAYYLCGMLNSAVVQDLLQRFGSTTAIAPQTLRRLPIPTFTDSNEGMRQIARLARKAHIVTGADLEQLVEQLDGHVNEVLTQFSLIGVSGIQ